MLDLSTLDAPAPAASAVLTPMGDDAIVTIKGHQLALCESGNVPHLCKLVRKAVKHPADHADASKAGKPTGEHVEVWRKTSSVVDIALALRAGLLTYQPA